MKLVMGMIWAALASGLAHGAAGDFDAWLSQQTEISRQAMLANIGPSEDRPRTARGAVTASPSRKPDYRAHWVRDGALTEATVLRLFERTQDSRYRTLVEEFAEFSKLNQRTPNASGAAYGAGLGEPKFELDGSAYTPPWGRPQDDGPALRAITLTRLATMALERGERDWVMRALYASELPARSVIKADLEYVAHHWRDTCFDLWEEVRGHHFYTRLVQRRALIVGAALAERLGDGGAAQFYRAEARALESEIHRHWDAKRKVLVATVDWSAGHTEKVSGLDVSIILGALHAQGDDSFYGISDDRVLATANEVASRFAQLYAINRRGLTDAGEGLGTAIGRYPEDVYSGEGPVAEGNPWFLATAAYAELCYRLAQEYTRVGEIRVTELNREFLRRHAPLVRHVQGEIIRVGSDRFAKLVGSLREAGDAYLRRVRQHAGGDGAMSEQFNRTTGVMQSAEQLTWSHAALLEAAWAR